MSTCRKFSSPYLHSVTDKYSASNRVPIALPQLLGHIQARSPVYILIISSEFLDESGLLGAVTRAQFLESPSLGV